MSILQFLGVNAMRNVISKVAAAAAILMSVATSADAFVILSMKDITALGGTDTKTCDTSIGITATNCVVADGFTIINVNQVTFLGSVGNFDIASANGITNVPGTAGLATANTTALTVTQTGTGFQNLVVDFIAWTYTQPTSILKNLDGSAAMTGNVFAAGDGVFSAFSVDSDTGTSFSGGPTEFTTSCLMLAAPSNNCDSPRILWADPLLGVAGFSTRTQQLFGMAAGSIIDGSTRLKITVPEPMSLSLVGVALLGLGFASRRRAAKKV